MTEKPHRPPARSQLQFTLSTLLILTVFVGALVGAWVRRNPIEVTRVHREAVHNQLTSGYEDELVDLYRAEKAKGLVRVDITHTESVRTGEWIDVTAIGICGTPDIFIYETRKQRYPVFPDFWWGHFYRPEVWIAILSGGALLARAWARTRRKQAGGRER